jgi:hypothetical protein
MSSVLLVNLFEEGFIFYFQLRHKKLLSLLPYFLNSTKIVLSSNVVFLLLSVQTLLVELLAVKIKKVKITFERHASALKLSLEF